MHCIAIPYCQYSNSAKCSDRISDWDVLYRARERDRERESERRKRRIKIDGRGGVDNKLRHYPITIIAASNGIVLFVVYVCSSCTHLAGINNGIVILKSAPQIYTFIYKSEKLMMNFVILELNAEKKPSPVKAHTWIASVKIEVTTIKYILCAFNVLVVLRRIHSVSLRFRAPYYPNTSKLYQDNVCFIDK